MVREHVCVTFHLKLTWNQLNWMWAGQRSAVLWAFPFIADRRYGSKVYNWSYLDHLTSQWHSTKPSFSSMYLKTSSFSKAPSDFFVHTWHYVVGASRMCTRVPGPPILLCVTLKIGSGLGTRLCTVAIMYTCQLTLSVEGWSLMTNFQHLE